MRRSREGAEICSGFLCSGSVALNWHKHELPEQWQSSAGCPWLCCRFVAFASATAAATTTRHACNCPRRLTLGQHCVMKWPCLLSAPPPPSSSSSSSSFPSLLHFGRIQIAFAARLKIGAFYSRCRREQRNGTHERPPKRAT